MPRSKPGAKPIADYLNLETNLQAYLTFLLEATKLKRELGAFAPRAANLNRAAKINRRVFFDNRQANAQAMARTVFGSVKRVKYMGQHVGSYTLAPISHLDC